MQVAAGQARRTMGVDAGHGMRWILWGNRASLQPNACAELVEVKGFARLDFWFVFILGK